MIRVQINVFPLLSWKNKRDSFRKFHLQESRPEKSAIVMMSHLNIRVEKRIPTKNGAHDQTNDDAAFK